MFFVPYFLLSYFLAGGGVVIVGTQVKHNVVKNSAQVFDLVVLLPHMRNSRGSKVLVSNELAS